MLEALDQIAVPRLLVRHIDGRMTVDAGTGLLELLDTLGERLVLEHVRVSALRSEVHRERVAGPHRLQPRILLEARLRHRRAGIFLAGRSGQRLAAAVARPLLVHRSQIRVVLHREVLAPDGRIARVVGDLHDAEEGLLCLTLALRDVDEERGERPRRRASPRWPR